MIYGEQLYQWALETLSGRPRNDGPVLYERLLAEHQGRAYHGWGHVRHVVGVASMLSLEANIDSFVWARVAFALFNHDRVYDPRRSDNEERSAERAFEDVPDQEVSRLILLTKNHETTDLPGAIVVDADLAILATPARIYDRYTAAIREEYTHLSEEEFRSGRSAFLEKTVSRAKDGRLFHADLLEHDQAIRNMQRELSRMVDHS